MYAAGHGGLIRLVAVQADLPARLLQGRQRPLQDGLQRHHGGQVLKGAQGQSLVASFYGLKLN